MNITGLRGFSHFQTLMMNLKELRSFSHFQILTKTAYKDLSRNLEN